MLLKLTPLSEAEILRIVSDNQVVETMKEKLVDLGDYFSQDLHRDAPTPGVTTAGDDLPGALNGWMREFFRRSRHALARGRQKLRGRKVRSDGGRT